MSGPMITVPFPPSMPTIRRNPFFNAAEDCKKIYDAMKVKGIGGTDENAIINALTKLSLSQRLELVSTYKQVYQKDLVEKLKKKLGGKLENAIVALLQPAEVYDAHSLHDAVCGLGTNEDTIIEILCSRSSEELNAVEKAYKTLYKEDLEKAIAGDTSGPVKRLLIARLTDERLVAYKGWPSRGFQVDLAKAQSDAKILFGASPKTWATNEAISILIFAQRSLAHLRVVFDEYKKLSNKEVEATIKDEMSGDVEAAFLAIAEFVNNKNVYFAKRLHESMKGVGTSDRKLLRIIVTRSENDLESIKEKFLQMYAKPLEVFIENDTSGDYKKLLLAIVQKNIKWKPKIDLGEVSFKALGKTALAVTSHLISKNE